jgi:hypothetical protein
MRTSGFSQVLIRPLPINYWRGAVFGPLSSNWRRGRRLLRVLPSPHLCISATAPGVALPPHIHVGRLHIGIRPFCLGSNPPNHLIFPPGAAERQPPAERWRRGRDSNPRYAVNVHTLSRRAPSTARTPLRRGDATAGVAQQTVVKRKLRARLAAMKIVGDADEAITVIRPAPRAGRRARLSRRTRQNHARSGEMQLPSCDYRSRNKEHSHALGRGSQPLVAINTAAH